MQIATDPTYISGSLLDLIYLHMHILDSMKVHIDVITYRFSDHDAVKFTLHYQE